LTAHFLATDAEGNACTVVAYRPWRPTPTRADSGAGYWGMGELSLEDGRSVNRLEQGVYEIAATGTRITSEDPNAV
jgi:hypothetical protein